MNNYINIENIKLRAFSYKNVRINKDHIVAVIPLTEDQIEGIFKYKLLMTNGWEFFVDNFPLAKNQILG